MNLRDHRHAGREHHCADHLPHAEGTKDNSHRIPRATKLGVGLPEELDDESHRGIAHQEHRGKGSVQWRPLRYAATLLACVRDAPAQEQPKHNRQQEAFAKGFIQL